MKSLLLALLCVLSLSAVAEAHGGVRVIAGRQAVVVNRQAVVVAQPSVTVINNRRGIFGLRRSQQIIVQ